MHVTVYWSCHLQHSVPLVCADTFDYTYPTTTYSFDPTDENEPIPSRVISIPIINDGDNERAEDFKLTLKVSAEDRAANVTEGPIRMTVVLIKDDDGKIKQINHYPQTLSPILLSLAHCTGLLKWKYVCLYWCTVIEANMLPITMYGLFSMSEQCLDTGKGCVSFLLIAQFSKPPDLSSIQCLQQTYLLLVVKRLNEVHISNYTLCSVSQ